MDVDLSAFEEEKKAAQVGSLRLALERGIRGGWIYL